MESHGSERLRTEELGFHEFFKRGEKETGYSSNDWSGLYQILKILAERWTWREMHSSPPSAYTSSLSWLLDLTNPYHHSDHLASNEFEAKNSSHPLQVEKHAENSIIVWASSQIGYTLRCEAALHWITLLLLPRHKACLILSCLWRNKAFSLSLSFLSRACHINAVIICLF